MKDHSNESQIRRLVENWAKAVQNQDLDGATARHTSDIVMFDVPMPHQAKGMEAYRKTWELFFFSNEGGPESFSIAELTIVANNSVAFAYALINIFSSTVRLSMGLKKIKGEWLIAHEHHSYPVELE